MAVPLHLRYLLLGGLFVISAVYLYSSRGPARASDFSFGPSSSSSSGSSSSRSPLALRILPLGDSVTFGYNDPTGNGYRYFLECMLSGRVSVPSASPSSPPPPPAELPPSHAVQYTGSHRHGNWPNLRNHGLTLHTIGLVNANVSGEASRPGTAGNRSAILRPNVVLTHLGTVNLELDGPGVVEAALAQLAETVALTAALWPAALQVVAQLATNSDAGVRARIGAFNARVPDVVRRAAAAGTKVLLASMVDVEPAELIDGVHPNGTGYMKMARRYYDVILDAERRGLIDELPRDMRSEVEEQQELDRESMDRCEQVFRDLEDGVVVKGDVVDDD